MQDASPRPFAGHCSLVLVLLAVLLAPSCSSTRLVDTWRTDTPRAAAIESLLIAGIAPTETERRSFEEQFAQEFQQDGIEARAAHPALAEKDVRDPDHVLRVARELELGGILAVQYRGLETREEYVPGQTRAVAYGTWHGYYGPAFDYVYSPGYRVQRRYLMLESRLYDTKNGDLLWSATSETYEPESIRELTRELAKLVIADLREAGLLR